MNGWFKSKQASIDAFVCAGAGSFAWFWFGEVIGFVGGVGLVFGAFVIAQLVRFVGAQFATLEWAKLQEAGLPEKRAKVLPRGDGYRDAGVIEDVPSPDVAIEEADIARRRAFALRSLGIIGFLASLSTLVPGFVFGAWAIPIVFAFLASVLALFVLTMRRMRRRQARVADDEFARQRVAVEIPKARIGVDFGVPTDEREEANDDTEEQRRRR